MILVEEWPSVTDFCSDMRDLRQIDNDWRGSILNGCYCQYPEYTLLVRESTRRICLWKKHSNWNLSLWTGVCSNGCVIGPFFYEGTLTGIKYGDMYYDRILPSIREAYGNMRRDIWFMQDGAQAHRGLNVRHKLHEVFGNRVSGLGFCQIWSPRSPDLTPCDIFLWVHIKNQVYSSPPATLEILRERIESEFDRLKEQPQQIRRVVRAMRKRAIRCIEREGWHVEGY